MPNRLDVHVWPVTAHFMVYDSLYRRVTKSQGGAKLGNKVVQGRLSGIPIFHKPDHGYSN